MTITAPPETTGSPRRRAVPTSLLSSTPATVTWVPPTARKTPRSELASPRLLDRELYLTDRFRTPHRYPRQQNIQGMYHFSSTNAHVWHESQLESNVLRWLDMTGGIVALSAQPMHIAFSDGTSHIPDMVALHSDHRQVVYDVKPRKFIPDFAEQFAKTRAFCEQVGFGYEIHHELPRQVEVNLNWVSGFKSIGYHPGPDGEERLRQSLVEPRPLREVAAALRLGSLARGRAALFHLVWTGSARFDLTLPISDRTIIERSR